MVSNSDDGSRGLKLEAGPSARFRVAIYTRSCSQRRRTPRSPFSLGKAIGQVDSTITIQETRSRASSGPCPRSGLTPARADGGWTVMSLEFTPKLAGQRLLERDGLGPGGEEPWSGSASRLRGSGVCWHEFAPADAAGLARALHLAGRRSRRGEGDGPPALEGRTLKASPAELGPPRCDHQDQTGDGVPHRRLRADDEVDRHLAR